MVGETLDMTNLRSYPIIVPSAEGVIALRPMVPTDDVAVLAFAQGLSAHDLLFLRRDISQPRVVAAWIKAERLGRVTTLLATRGGAVLGCATIVTDSMSWSRHVGEMRVIVESSARGKGLGQKLTQLCFLTALDMGLEKMTAQMTVDQRGAITVFEGMGFRAEALLRDHVEDRDGHKHDIVILSHDVAKFQGQMAAYGLTSAL